MLLFVNGALHSSLSCVSHISVLVCLLPSWAAAHHHGSVAQLSHRNPLWRELPYDVWGQRESRAGVSTKSRSYIDIDNRHPLDMLTAINTLCSGVLVLNLRKWISCSPCWMTQHFNTACLGVDSDGRRMARNSTPLWIPVWWKRRILGPLWYLIMGTLQSTRDPIAVTPQTNWGLPYRRRLSSLCPVSNICVCVCVCVGCSVTALTEWFRASSHV